MFVSFSLLFLIVFFFQFDFKGTPRNALTNFIRLDFIEPNKGFVFEYEVRFEPEVYSNGLRYALLRQQVPVIGQTRTFDGVDLCLPIQLPDRVIQLKSINPVDNSEVKVIIIYKGRKKSAECQQLYGNLFSKIMKILKFVRFGTKHFDPKEPKVIPQHKLEIWPGFVTGLSNLVMILQQWSNNEINAMIYILYVWSIHFNEFPFLAVNECNGGIMLCVDVTHRVLRQTAVLDVLQHAYRSASGNMEDFKRNVAQAIIGAIVLTR